MVYCVWYIINMILMVKSDENDIILITTDHVNNNEKKLWKNGVLTLTDKIILISCHYDIFGFSSFMWMTFLSECIRTMQNLGWVTHQSQCE